MGSFAGATKMIPGIGGQIDTNQITEVVKRLEKCKAMIGSMTKKERANPDCRTQLRVYTKIVTIVFLSWCNWISEHEMLGEKLGELDS